MSVAAAAANPYLGIASSVLGAVGGLKAAPAGPNVSGADAFNPWTSGDWTVATGGSKAASGAEDGNMVLYVALGVVGLWIVLKFR